MTPVEQIKQRLGIIEVIGSYITLTKAGSSYKALCPFHNEKSPSFNVSPTRDAYYCFGCNRGGDIFTFVEEIEGVAFPEALRMLAARAGVQLENMPREKQDERERLLEIMETATVFFQKHLVANQEAMRYLRDRGLKTETMREFRLGFAPLEWHACRDHLVERGFAGREIERAGIVKPGENGLYDRFRGRIMFPIRDTGGRVIAFTGRTFGHQTMPDGGAPAKYLNSPEGPLYNKSAILFNYDLARAHMRKQNFAILVEGQMDCLMAIQAGTENVVAVSGTALTEWHLGLIKRITDNVVFAFDADDAGLQATRRAFMLALAVGLGVRVAAIPGGKDPADTIKEDPDAWMRAIAESAHVVDFFLNALGKKGYDPRRYRQEVEKEVLPIVLAIPSKIEEAHFIVEIARRLGVPEQAVWEEAKRLSAALPPGREAENGDIASSLRTEIKSFRRLTEESVWGIIFWQEAHEMPVLDVVTVRTRYLALMEEHGIPHFVPNEEEERILAIRAEHSHANEPELCDAVDEMLDTLEGEVLREKQEELWRQLADAENRGDKAAVTEITKQYQTITPRRIALENRRVKRAR